MKARILHPTDSDLALALNALRLGEPVAIPTETVYGLAGLAFDSKALAKIFDLKERPRFDPLIIHVSAKLLSKDKTLPALEQVRLIELRGTSPRARTIAEGLIDRFWPGPLTLVLPKSDRVPDLATGGLSTVAIRMPWHPIAQQILAQVGAPLAAPSANRFGRISPTSADDVFQELGDRVAWIIEGGRCEIGLESSVLAVENSGELVLLRPGAVSQEDIERVANAKVTVNPPAERARPLAPGMLDSHYAPKKPLHLLPSKISALKENPIPGARLRKIGALVLSGFHEEALKGLSRLFPERAAGDFEIRILSETGDVAEMARNLFSQMRELDRSDAETLLAEPYPDERGLGHAIMDRLRRASQNKPRSP